MLDCSFSDFVLIETKACTSSSIGIKANWKNSNARSTSFDESNSCVQIKIFIFIFINSIQHYCFKNA
jgi:hypothetical protein